MKQIQGSSTDPGLVLVRRALGDYFIIADSICDLMQLLEISKDSIESVPVTRDNRLINHSPSAPWHLWFYFRDAKHRSGCSPGFIFIYTFNNAIK